MPKKDRFTPAQLIVLQPFQFDFTPKHHHFIDLRQSFLACNPVYISLVFPAKNNGEMEDDGSELEMEIGREIAVSQEEGRCWKKGGRIEKGGDS